MVVGVVDRQHERMADARLRYVDSRFVAQSREYNRTGVDSGPGSEARGVDIEIFDLGAFGVGRCRVIISVDIEFFACSVGFDAAVAPCIA